MKIVSFFSALLFTTMVMAADTNLCRIIDWEQLFDKNPVSELPISNGHHQYGGKAMALFLLDLPISLFDLGEIKKKFNPDTPKHQYKYLCKLSNNLDIVTLGIINITIHENSGKNTAFNDRICDINKMRFSSDANQIFDTRYQDDKVLFAKKIDGKWKSIQTDFAKSYQEKAGYYLVNGKILFINPEQDLIKSENYYLGQIKDQRLFTSDEDEQRNYLCPVNQLISSNKEYLAFVENSQYECFVAVHKLAIFDNKLTSSLLYKAAIPDTNYFDVIAIAGNGDLSSYDGKKYFCGGTNDYTNEHFFFLVLVHSLKDPLVRTHYGHKHISLARIAHQLIDYGFIKAEFRAKFGDNKIGLLLVLERLYGDLRYLDGLWSIRDADYEFRKKYYYEDNNNQKRQLLLRRVALEHAGSAYKFLKNNMAKIHINQSTISLFNDLFNNDDLSIIFAHYQLQGVICSDFSE